jgi:hypothetical protein
MVLFLLGNSFWWLLADFFSIYQVRLSKTIPFCPEHGGSPPVSARSQGIVGVIFSLDFQESLQYFC